MADARQEGDRFEREIGGFDTGETREPKECEGCGYTRKVKIRRSSFYLVEYERRRASGGYLEDVEVGREFIRTVETFNHLCIACDYMQRALYLEVRATVHRKKAQAIYNKRLDKSLANKGGKQ